MFAGIFILNSCEEDPLNLFSDDPRDGITGEWVVDEDSELFKKKALNRFYNVNITKHPADTSAIYVDGFYEINDRVKIIMNNRNLNIPDQVVDGFSIEDGYGSISFDFETITLYYDVAFTGERDIVRADYTRPENR
jgi:hypothetical protein